MVDYKKDIQSMEFEVYKHLRDFESNFNSMHMGMHKLVSIWLLATLAGIAYSYTLKSENSFPVDRPTLASIVALLGSSGIFILWLVDQRVYQKLLGAAFFEGARMEHNNLALPQVRRLMWYASGQKGHRGMSKYLRWLYIAPILALGCVSLLGACEAPSSSAVCRQIPAELAPLPAKSQDADHRREGVGEVPDSSCNSPMPPLGKEGRKRCNLSGTVTSCWVWAVSLVCLVLGSYIWRKTGSVATHDALNDLFPHESFEEWWSEISGNQSKPHET